ncbi:virulence factor family protein [Xylella taiwanensis]|uniref:Acid virulence protein B n=1 Tax=Xylella taiwanensis TaxID=1444770 RepID=Z9JK30_9GAMM|nr:AcvB/VirJ family lysyl-phosphatidylglycerol hydrolase [Xylella taiwanensis]AXI84352.1 acid virulence protein B [Xylella taiwanensis]EWS78092.1 acid virulence protein B [Xylella taiwanensis]MCD8457472.1 virulence factor family protein [Xylella taiwanensis]MCD8457631.1 virulence factor family protein [Xylella taiwanensis]MCD8461244.1 virulence factor family protein [Xylella taiwanensis]
MQQSKIRSILQSIALLALAGTVAAESRPEKITHGRFEQIQVLRPHGEPQRVVIWFGDARHVDQRARQAEVLRQDGAMVALVDTTRLYKRLYKVLAANPGRCAFSVGDVENLSRYLQAYYRDKTYRLPLLVSDGEGSGLAYAVAAQAPENILAGVVSDGLCPVTVPAHAICGAGVGNDQRLKPAPVATPLLVITMPSAQCPAQVTSEFVRKVAIGREIRRGPSGDLLLPGLSAALRVLGAQKGVTLPPPPADLDGLPVVEVPSKAQKKSDTFAIFVSGDGGWAEIDKKVAGHLADADIPVVGLDSLRYFWSKRTPADFAKDLDRIARFYAHHWERSRLLLVGFSQGADVLPSAINRLSSNTRQMIRMTALLSLGKYANYEFHVSNWITSDDGGIPIAPEMVKLKVASAVCIYGVDDKKTLCPSLPQQSRRVALPGTHHFNGDYETVARTILAQMEVTP